MKKVYLRLSFFIAISIMVFTACKKDDPEPIDTSTPTTGSSKGDFKYALNGGAILTADSSKGYLPNTTIFAFKNNANTTFEINLSALTVGVYGISSSTGNQLTYSAGSTDYNGVGSLTISSNNSSKLSGSFSCSLSSGTLTGLTGTFVDVPLN